LHQVDQIIRQFPDVVSTYGVVNSEVDSGKNHAGLGVTLKPKQERSADLTTLNNEFRDRLQSVAGIRVTSVAAAQDSVSGGQKPIMISIKGSDLNELQKISDRFMTEMEKIDGVVDLESSLKEPKPTLGVHINRVLA
ncbi:efflux RND transporter permease subunit, partial [Acinetobacter baumannii]